MKIVHFVIFIFVVILSYSCENKTNKSKEKPPASVDVVIAEKIAFSSFTEVNGYALSEEMVELFPEISGRLIYLNIPDGAFVTAGTLLAKINDAELQAQLEQQNAQLDLAVKTEQRLKTLLSVNGVNQSEYDIALNQLNSINANIKVLNAQIEKTMIKAPFSGKLGLRLVSVGAFVNTQTLIGTLQQVDKIKIDFTVPETYSNLISVGNKINVQLIGIDEKQVATITAVEPQINLDTRNIKVRAKLNNGNVSPGSFVKVILDKKEECIIIPSNVIIPDASSNKVILIKNKKAVFTDVETGIRTADNVEILKGINPGDTVVVSGVLFVRPKGDVKIRKVKKLVDGNIQDAKPIVK